MLMLVTLIVELFLSRASAFATWTAFSCLSVPPQTSLTACHVYGRIKFVQPGLLGPVSSRIRRQTRSSLYELSMTGNPVSRGSDGQSEKPGKSTRNMNVEQLHEAIQASTGQAAPSSSTRKQLLRTLQAARNPRNKTTGGSGVSAPGASSKAKENRYLFCSRTRKRTDWEKFQDYYSMQLPLPPHEMDLFFKTMLTPLPVTFRLVSSSAQAGAHDGAAAHFESRILAALDAGAANEGDEDDDEKTQVRRLQWYPAYSAAWQIDSSRRQMRSPRLKPVQKLLVDAVEEGIVSRQEAVSMLPPLFLHVSPGDTVLDLCAAPGSKTGQLLELTALDAPARRSTGERGERDGAVVANDSDRERLQMMIARQKCLSSPRLVATNYPGQCFPSVGEAGIGYFDAVLCDVPCESGVLGLGFGV